MIVFICLTLFVSIPTIIVMKIDCRDWYDIVLAIILIATLALSATFLISCWGCFGTTPDSPYQLANVDTKVLTPIDDENTYIITNFNDNFIIVTDPLVTTISHDNFYDVLLIIDPDAIPTITVSTYTYHSAWSYILFADIVAKDRVIVTITIPSYDCIKYKTS